MAAAYISRAVTRSLRQHGAKNLSKWESSLSHFSSDASAVSAVSQQEQDKNGRSAWSKLFLFVPGAITFGLGTWQIFRRQEKIKVLEYQQSRLERQPLQGNEIVPSNSNLDALEFRRIHCKGIYDEKKSIFVGPRSRSISGVTENGYYLVTPLIPVPGNPESVQSPVLVNRGWVPRSWRYKALNVSEDEELVTSSPTSSLENTNISWWRFWSKKPEILEEKAPAITLVEVIGVVRGGENPSIFVPANDPNASQWFYVDVPALACACGLSENTLYIEDINDNINPSIPYPIPKDVNALIRSSVMPQDHLNYALTWYSLSAAVTFMAVKRLKPTKSKR